VVTSQASETLVAPPWLTRTAATMTSVDAAVISRPQAIFAGVDGSFPARRSHANAPTTSGVNTMMKNGLIDCINSVEMSVTFSPGAGRSRSGTLAQYDSGATSFM